MGQVVDTKKYHYDRIKVRGPDGKARYTAGNQDAVAKSLFGMNLRKLQGVAKVNNIDLKAHANKNIGHYRMILGQSLRSMIARNVAVVIGGLTVTKTTQKVAWPEGFKQEPKGTHAKPIRKKS